MGRHTQAEYDANPETEDHDKGVFSVDEDDSGGSSGSVIGDMFSAEDANQPDTKTGPQQYGGTPNGAQQESDYWRGSANQAGGQANAIYQGANDVQGRAAPTINQGISNQYLNQAQDSRYLNQTDTQALRNQADALGAYAAQGPGPSAAEAQLSQATDRNMQEALALARSGRGAGESASALRGAMGQRANIQQQSAGQLALTRATEADAWRGRQLEAMGQQTGALNAAQQATAQQRVTDLQAQGMTAEQAQAQAALEMQQSMANDAQQLGLYGAAQGMYGVQQGAGELSQAPQEAQLTANTDVATANASNALNARLGNQQADLEKDTGIFGMVGGLFGSDVRLKDEIQPTGDGEYTHKLEELAGHSGYTPQDLEQLKTLNYQDRLKKLAGYSGYSQEELDQLHALGGSLRRPETTQLSPEQELAFQHWAKANNISDVDHPDSHYDYRGFYLQEHAPKIRGGVDHFPDTFKQHGHPTFSRESRYSKGDGDGGVWEGEVFHPPIQAPKKGAHAYTITEDAPPEDRIVHALSKADGYQYEYKDPSRPGAAPGTHYGPMAQDLAKTPEGRSVLFKTPDGMLGVDAGRLALMEASGIAGQQKQIEDLKRQLEALQR